MSQTERQRHLSLDDAKFFQRAMAAYESVRNTDSARDFFAPIDQALSGKEILIAQHRICSRFMESYIQECPLGSLQRLFSRFSGQLSAMSLNKFSSHTVEHLVKQGIQFLDADVRPSFTELLASVITELTPGAAALAEDASGSHVARLILGELSKPDVFTQKVDKFARRIIQAVVKSGCVRSAQLSATLQVVAQFDQARFGKLVRYLVASVPLVWRTIADKSGSMLAEALVRHAGRDAAVALFESVFAQSAVDAAHDHIANFVLQRWLECAEDVPQIERVADQLMPRMGDLLE